MTGLPAEDPEKPDPINNALEIATIELPPYLYRVEDASISFLDHKRFTMRDIGKLEDRIRNLEYYTSLTMLETETLICLFQTMLVLIDSNQDSL